jgi:hypothetical protein
MLWSLEEVCSMLEERKQDYWWEVNEEEKEYNIKVMPLYLKQLNR